MKKNTERKEVLALYVVQFSNLIIPLLSFPYLINILGVDNFGKVGFAQTLLLIFCFIIDFGFNLSAARYISTKKSENNSIYSTVIIIKLFIYVVLFFFGNFFVLFSAFNQADKIIWLLVSFLCLGSVITPNFLFNGLGINSVLAIISLLCRIFFLIPLFIFVNNSDQYNLAIILQFMPNILIGLISTIYVIFKLNVNFNFKYFDFNLAIEQLNEAFHNFSASGFTLGFTYAIPLLVKSFLGDAALGIYTIVERLLNILKQAYLPLIQAFYSKSCFFYETRDWANYAKILINVFKIYILIGVFSLTTNYFIGEEIIGIFITKDINLVDYLSIGIFNQIIISIAMIMVNLYIIPIGKGRVLKKIYFFGMIVFLLTFNYMQRSYGLMGVFYSMLLVETVITLIMVYISYVYYRNIIKN